MKLYLTNLICQPYRSLSVRETVLSLDVFLITTSFVPEQLELRRREREREREFRDSAGTRRESSFKYSTRLCRDLRRYPSCSFKSFSEGRGRDIYKVLLATRA